MPGPPGAVVDVDAILQGLTAALRADLAAASEAIDAELAEILDRWPGETRPVRYRNLQSLQRHVATLMSHAAELARASLPEAITGAYQLGGSVTALAAQRAATFAGVDRATVTAIARDAYADLLDATEHMTDTTKDVVRRLVRDHSRDRVLTGRTAEQAATRLARDLQGQGISAIVYRNGANHSLADYADMVVRTKTAEAFQRGGLAQGAALGIEWWELLDNPECGLDGHNDPTKANGQIVPRETAERFLISHPRCVRVTTARPDIASREQAGSAAARSAATEPGRVADQQLVAMAREELAARRATRTALARRAARGASRLEDRTARAASGALAPRVGAAGSKAARARAAKIAARRS